MRPRPATGTCRGAIARILSARRARRARPADWKMRAPWLAPRRRLEWPQKARRRISGSCGGLWSRSWFSPIRNRSGQRPGLLQILRLDRLQRVEGEGAHGAGRVVAAVLRKGARADREHVVHVPALEILVHRARLRIRAHGDAAGVV